MHVLPQGIHVFWAFQQNGETMFVQIKGGIGHFCAVSNDTVPLTLIFDKFQIADLSLGAESLDKGNRYTK